jgi:uncharacterized BrkB/YihY/UPF0761 family membrane protein
MKKNNIIKTFLNTVKILLLISCIYSTYIVVGYWKSLIENDFFEMIPFPMLEVEVLFGVSLLIILLWLLYFYLAESPKENN